MVARVKMADRQRMIDDGAETKKKKTKKRLGEKKKDGKMF